MRLTFLGSGDAFGSGGRMAAALLLQAGATMALVDCGPGAVAALQARGIAVEEVDLVLVSHLHGDHFGGIPFMLLRAAHAEGRRRPFVVAGPPGTRERLDALLETMYPGTRERGWPFPLEVVELEEDRATAIGELTVRPIRVVHPSGAPAFGLRIELGGRLLAYSGDTEWTDALRELARDADLFVCECNSWDREVPGHLDHRRLSAERASLGARRMLLTHMGDEMLAHLPESGFEGAHDGLEVEL